MTNSVRLVELLELFIDIVGRIRDLQARAIVHNDINPDMIHASGNLKLRPRDMAKLGYLFLNRGKWEDNRIVSEEWIDQSTKGYMLPTWADGYGYQWWLMTYRSSSPPIGSYFAAGWGGQRIIVFPSLEMVVVFTGGNYVEEEPVDVIIEQHILPAVR